MPDDRSIETVTDELAAAIKRVLFVDGGSDDSELARREFSEGAARAVLALLVSRETGKSVTIDV